MASSARLDQRLDRSCSNAVDLLPCPGDQLRQRRDPGDAGALAPMLDEQERREALHRKARRQIRGGLGVHPSQTEPWLEACRSLFEDRGHGMARAAPGGPEIDEQRKIATFGVL